MSLVRGRQRLERRGTSHETVAASRAFGSTASPRRASAAEVAGAIYPGRTARGDAREHPLRGRPAPLRGAAASAPQRSLELTRTRVARTLVTGGNGFIGSALVRALADRG